jgi:hypothetical protein
MATATHSVNGAVVTVDLAAVADRQTAMINLTNVSNGGATANVSLPFRVLQGDVTPNGSVGASDIGQTKAASGQAVGEGNFRADVNVSGGAIGASDIGLVKSKAGNNLPL